MNFENLHNIWTNLLDSGGWTLIALLLCSILMLATSLVLFILIYPLRPFSTTKGATRRLAQNIQSLKQKQLSRQAVEEAVQSFAKTQLRTGYTGFRILEFIATAAPLLGLLGTILGMIEAFQAMESAGGSVKPSDLAGGIWEALITTAAGMVIALIALAIHSIFELIMDHLRFKMEAIATQALTQAG